MLGWAKHWEVIPALPFNLRDLNMEGDGARHAVITSADEYSRLFEQMAGMVAAGTLRREVRPFIVLVASTGLRRGEAQGLRWGQVSLEGRQVTLTNTKGAKLPRMRGKGQSRAEVVGLFPVAAAALAGVMPETPPRTRPARLVI
jgi:integrase